jgi:hypothetical protein
MTITERTADVRRRLDEIEATAGLPAWTQRKEHLIRATFAHAAALAGERDKAQVYVAKGIAWWDANPHLRGTPVMAEKEEKIIDAIVACAYASETLRDALRILTPIEGAEMPATWNPGVFDTEDAV